MKKFLESQPWLARNEKMQISKRKKLNYPSFTLVEVIVTLCIFTLILVSIYLGLTLSQRGYREGEKLAEITQNGRVILERMTREIRQAKEMVTQLPSDETDATSTIEFQEGHRPPTCPNVEPETEYYYIRYYLNQNEVKRVCLVYCLDECQGLPNVCSSYHKWNESGVHPCILEEKTIGEYVDYFGFWDYPIINLSITLKKDDKFLNLRTKIYGRNL